MPWFLFWDLQIANHSDFERAVIHASRLDPNFIGSQPPCCPEKIQNKKNEEGRQAAAAAAAGGFTDDETEDNSDSTAKKSAKKCKHVSKSASTYMNSTG